MELRQKIIFHVIFFLVFFLQSSYGNDSEYCDKTHGCENNSGEHWKQQPNLSKIRSVPRFNDQNK